MIDGAGQPEPLFVTAASAAAMFAVSERQWRLWNSSGACPAPAQCQAFGRSVRWGVAERRAWSEAGMPPREQWEQQQLDTVTR